jgi:hypothetical protein
MNSRRLHLDRTVLSPSLRIHRSFRLRLVSRGGRSYRSVKILMTHHSPCPPSRAVIPSAQIVGEVAATLSSISPSLATTLET